MSEGRLSAKVLAAKVEVVREMLRGIASLPLASEAAFVKDPRMVAAGESFLRRALEALLDLGRHLLAKGCGIATVEYKAIPEQLQEAGLLEAELAGRLRQMAGYRNRMVHFYDEVTAPELYGILTRHLGDVEAVLEALQDWARRHPEKLSTEL